MAGHEKLDDTGPTEHQSQLTAGDRPWLKHYPKHVSWESDYVGRALPEMFDEAVKTYPDNVCTLFLGKELTYAEIGALTDQAAVGLQQLGVKKGSRVGLFLPNCPTFIVFYFAILKAGGTVVNYNPLYTVEQLQYQAEDSQTDIMVTLDLKLLFDKVEQLLALGTVRQAIVCPFANLLPGAKSLLFRVFKFREIAHPGKSSQRDKIVLLGDLVGTSGTLETPQIDPYNDTAVLQYTGGTTGTPKAAMLSHANLSINQQQILSWQEDFADGGSTQETIMGILPFFHVFAMTTVMNLGVLSGSRIILIPKFELKEGLKIMDRLKPTLVPGVPTLYNAISNFPDLAKYDLSSIKFCISGGAPLPVEVKREFEQLTGCSLREGYGLSETSPVATCNPISGLPKEGSIGVPFPATHISIRSLEDPSKEVPLKEKGEICIAGPQVMKGYWNKSEETAKAFVGDYFRTGDVGYMDEDGYIFIVDRLKDLILCSGFNVYPRRIEDAIYQHPAVEEVTVLGVPDDYRGEAPKAYVKLKEGESATEEDIQAFLKEKLSKIELPSEIEFRNELPKTMIGKLSKKELREEMSPPDAG